LPPNLQFAVFNIVVGFREDATMRIGLMSDIHGNVTALRAVLSDAAAFDVDSWWVLGDIVAIGPDPVETIVIIKSLPNVQVIAGNTERYVLTGDLPSPSLPEVAADPSLLPRLVEMTANFAWTRGAVTTSADYDWLASLGAEIRLTLPDGTRVLGIHASPKSDDGPGIDHRITDDDLEALLLDCHADVVIGGHTHDVTDRTVANVRAVNLGSVSNPTRTDGRATYAIVSADSDGYELHPRVVDYDHAEVLARIDEVRHPAALYLRRFFRDAR
jgi:putative phosphoesterase